ncbi:hypothetical protein GOP47_0028098 [Adiantum capillus-veneris]|nr:hypothetical protein GOP47_0028098 [Adiantum capillus-veneris]
MAWILEAKDLLRRTDDLEEIRRIASTSLVELQAIRPLTNVECISRGQGDDEAKDDGNIIVPSKDGDGDVDIKNSYEHSMGVDRQKRKNHGTSRRHNLARLLFKEFTRKNVTIVHGASLKCEYALT